MAYDQSTHTDYYKVKNQFPDGGFPLLGIRSVKKPFTTKPFPKGFTTGNKAIKEEENIISRLLSDIVLAFF